MDRWRYTRLSGLQAPGTFSLDLRFEAAKFIAVATSPIVLIVCFAQGIATRNASPKPKVALSGRPFPVRFVDVAQESGLHMQFVSGSEQSKSTSSKRTERASLFSIMIAMGGRTFPGERLQAGRF